MRKKRLAIIIKYWTFFKPVGKYSQTCCFKRNSFFFLKISVNLFFFFFFFIFGFGKFAKELNQNPYTINFMLGQHPCCSIRIFFSENIRIVLGQNFLFYTWVYKVCQLALVFTTAVNLNKCEQIC